MRPVTAIALLLVLLLTGCGVVQTISGMQEQASQASALLQNELGTRPHIEWNITNDRLTYVNVVFDGEAIGSLSIGDLSAKVRKTLSTSLQKKPERVMVSVRVRP